MNGEKQDSLLTIQEELDRMAAEVPEVPENFHASWVRAVEEDMNQNSENQVMQENLPLTPKKKGTWKKVLAIAAALVFVIGGTAVSRDWLVPRTRKSVSSNSYSSYNGGAEYGSVSSRVAGYGDSAPAVYAMYSSDADMAPMEVAYEESAEAEVGTSSGADLSQKKIIRTVTMTMGTKAYDDLYETIRRQCEAMGGWVEYANESTSSYSGLRTASLTLRIPQEKLDLFTESIRTEGRIISRSESANDVTESYQDTQARLATQQGLMARLQALVTDAADLSDLLELENQIADTQYAIDRLQSSLNSTDRKVSYSTVDLTLKEEKENADVADKELTFGERIAAAFSVGLEDFEFFVEDMVIFLTSALPFLLLIAAVIVTVVLVRRHHRKKHPKA